MKLKADLSDAQSKTGLQNISESLKSSFGKDAVLKTFNDYGTRSRLLTESGNNYADRKSGILGTVGATLTNVSKVKAHNFHGNE